ncbi:MAG: PAS domain S-box protein [Balneolales bacterium]
MKKSVLPELEKLKLRNDKLESEQKVLSRLLAERLKEQSCLHAITRLSEQDISMEDLLTQAVQLIPAGFQYPERTGAEISSGGKSYRTANYKDSGPDLTVKHICSNQRPIQIKVVVRAQNHPDIEDPFLTEESQLLHSIIRTLCLSIDRKHKETEKEALHKHNELLLDSISEGLCGMNMEGRCTFINEAALRMLGYEREDCLGANMHELVHSKKKNGAIYPQSECPIFLSKDDFAGCRVNSEVFWKADGSSLDVEYASVPVIDEGTIVGVVVTFKDITIKKRNEEKIRFQAHLLDQIGEAVIATDLDGKITHWNKAAQKLYGWTSEEIMGRNIIDITPDGSSKKQAAEIMTLLKKGKKWSDEFLVKRKDGTTFPAMVTNTPVTGNNGDLIGIVGVSSDLSERKQAERVLSESLKEKEILLAEVHHRVKNNLAVISSLLTLQAESLTDEGLIDIFEQSVSRIQTMALIHEMLYRSESFATIDIEKYLKRMIPPIIGSFNMFGMEIDIDYEAKGIHLDVQTAIPCGMIINELISNAHKHAFIGRDEGNVNIEFTKTGDRHTLTVRDDGVGLPPDFLTGDHPSLGLIIVQELTDQIGGTLQVNENNGTEFVITFTLEQSP